MPRRRIGQEAFGFDRRETATALDELIRPLDWAAVEGALDTLPVARRAEAAWPALALFRALPIAVWHDLSDAKRAEALDDRASFRCFYGFSRFGLVPERTAFVGFRCAVVGHGLDQRLCDVVTGQLRARAVTVKTGTLVDATVIAHTLTRARSLHRDAEARPATTNTAA